MGDGWKWLTRGLATLFSGLVAFHAPTEADVYWHMALGRAAFRASSRTVPEPYAIELLGDPRVVPEWLWGLVTWGVHQLGGMSALTWLAVLVCALAGFATATWIDALCREARERGQPLGAYGQLLLTAACVVMVSARLRLRPEAIALVFLPWFLLEARAFTSRSGRARVHRGVLLVGITVLWAQLHGSFVLAPALFAACVLDRRLEEPGARRSALAVFGVLCVAMASSAYGVDVVRYVLEHSGTDATRHVGDMQPGGWSDLAPFASPYGMAMTLSLLGSLAGLVFGPLRWADAGLALLGIAMFSTATRFGSMMTVLCMPLAVAGFSHVARNVGERSAGRLRVQHASQLALVLLSVALLGTTLEGTQRRFGLLAAGSAIGAYPLRGAAKLEASVAPANVYTSFLAGSVVGFLGDGSLRVSLDSRVPLHFDSTQYALVRDAASNPGALSTYFRRHAIKAAVVKRGSAECPVLASELRLVSVDPMYATFVLGAPDAGLVGVDPCGSDHVAFGCNDEKGLFESIDELTRQRKDVYVDWLRTVAELECKRVAPEAAYAAFPAPRTIPNIADAIARWRVRALWRAGRRDEALAELEANLHADDPRAITVMSELWASDMPVREMRALYEQGVDDMDDEAPPRDRGKLAFLCFAQADYECARFHGLRAALLGDAAARQLLERLAQTHPNERAREDIARWLAAIPVTATPTHTP